MSDFETWYAATYSRYPNYLGCVITRSAAEAAWDAATNRCAELVKNVLQDLGEKARAEGSNGDKLKALVEADGALQCLLALYPPQPKGKKPKEGT